MVKPNQYDVEQDDQGKEREVDKKDPTVDVLVDGGKIFRSDKLPSRIVGDTVNRSAAKRIDRKEKNRALSEVLDPHYPTPRKLWLRLHRHRVSR